MENNRAELMDKGITCLLRNLGAVQTERFISNLIQDKSDYTKWRRQHFGEMSDEEYLQESIAYDKSHPFVPKREQFEVE